MILHYCEQRSIEWYKLRAGIPTASAFNKIVTANGAPSKQADEYMLHLLAEKQLGPLDMDLGGFAGRGSALEEEALDWYEFNTDYDTEAIGFVTLDDGTAGCSPDRLVNEKGGAEFKCLMPKHHLAATLSSDSDRKYMVQIQGNLWITEREWWDLVYYHPKLAPVTRRIVRDEAFIELLAAAISCFTDAMASKNEALIARNAWRPDDYVEESA
jgi:hypothetical protein